MAGWPGAEAGAGGSANNDPGAGLYFGPMSTTSGPDWTVLLEDGVGDALTLKRSGEGLMAELLSLAGGCKENFGAGIRLGLDDFVVSGRVDDAGSSEPFADLVSSAEDVLADAGGKEKVGVVVVVVVGNVVELG